MSLKLVLHPTTPREKALGESIWWLEGGERTNQVNTSKWSASILKLLSFKGRKDKFYSSFKENCYFLIRLCESLAQKDVKHSISLNLQLRFSLNSTIQSFPYAAGVILTLFHDITRQWLILIGQKKWSNSRLIALSFLELIVEPLQLKTGTHLTRVCLNETSWEFPEGKFPPTVFFGDHQSPEKMQQEGTQRKRAHRAQKLEWNSVSKRWRKTTLVRTDFFFFNGKHFVFSHSCCNATSFQSFKAY